MIIDRQDDFSGKSAADYFFRFFSLLFVALVRHPSKTFSRIRLGYVKNEEEAVMVNQK